MNIKKRDTVLVISGNERGKKGRVLKVFPKQDRVVVEGVHVVKKHQRPKKTGEQGQIVEIPAPIHASNVKLVCPHCGKPTRVGHKETKGEKHRICKKCGKKI